LHELILQNYSDEIRTTYSFFYAELQSI